jgi:hypothetical protein
MRARPTPEALSALVADGLTARQIADAIDRPERSVRYWLAQDGSTPRRGMPGGEIGARPSKVDTPDGPLTLARLKSLLRLDEATGIFYRLTTRGRMHAGDEAGAVSGSRGYVMVGVDGRQYLAHRLGYFYRFGAWPPAQLDHINGDRADNRPANLRLATRVENAQNRRAKGTGVSGLLGVSKARGRWSARITVEGRRTYLGYWADPAKAHEAYLAAKRVHHPFNTL